MEHRLPDRFLHNPIRIHVVGCGGTGSQLIPGLVALHKTLVALGHPHGLEVTVWDADAVAEHNCIRQNFFLPDVGRNKAEVMVNRINLAHAASGIRWQAEPRMFGREALALDWGDRSGCTLRGDFVIGCVDSTAARAAILDVVMSCHTDIYWLDCGNSSDSGQFVAGEWHGGSALGHGERLPLVSEFFPEIVQAGKNDDSPSCSAVQSIQRQGVVTNRFAATLALSWLDEALRQGRVGWNGAFFNIKAGRVTPIPVDPAAWARMGVREPTVAPAAERIAA